MIRSPKSVKALSKAKMGTPMTIAQTETLMPCQDASSIASETMIMVIKSIDQRAVYIQHSD